MTEDRGTVLDLVDRNAAEHPEVTAVIDGATRLTWAQYRTRARAVALALLDLGVVPGEVIGLHQVNRAEHVLSDVGALFAGATPTSFYNTLAPDQLRYVAGDSAATVVILDADKLPLWLSIRDQLPGLRALVVLDLGPDEEMPPGVYRFAELVDAAAAHLTQRLGEIEAAAAKVQPDGALTIVYTSGTTGAPKGTIITHAGAR
jgi:long-chain acyl-CoA synthetase